MIRIKLAGTLGADVELRCTPDGTPVANARLATRTKVTGPDGTEREEIEWYNILLRGDLALPAEALVRGMQLTVEGELRYREYTTAGRTRAVPHVHALEITAPQPIFAGAGGVGCSTTKRICAPAPEQTGA